MKQSNLLFMSAAMMLASCGGTKDAGQNGTLIERSDIKIEGKRMTPEALWAMGKRPIKLLSFQKPSCG